MNYYSFATDCIDPDQLRDNINDGGTPTQVDTRLWADKERAIDAMLEEINDHVQQAFDDDDSDYHPGIVTREHLKDGMYSNEDLGSEWYIVTYAVQE
jgi:hypothetical protein